MDVSLSGKMFHKVGAALEKAWSPHDLSLVKTNGSAISLIQHSTDNNLQLVVFLHQLVVITNMLTDPTFFPVSTLIIYDI